MEILHNETIVFTINDIQIELISEEITEDYFNTYYMIDTEIYCLGNEPPDIATAIMAYENFFNEKLPDSKVHALYEQAMR